MLKNINLLVTCVGGSTAETLLREIKKSHNYNYNLVGVDANLESHYDNSIETTYVVPSGNAEGYIESMLTICEKEEIDFILPGSDEEALALSKNRSLFDNIDVHVLVSGEKCLSVITDKLATYQRLEQAGIRVPEYKVVNNGYELTKALYEYGYPECTIISKPAVGRGGRGLYVFKGKGYTPNWLGKGKREKIVPIEKFNDQIANEAIFGQTLVMPILDAPAYDADVVAKSGSVEVVVVRERKNPAGIPFTGNIVSMNGPIIDYCTSITSALELNSLHDIDLMTDTNGNTCIIEVNPRPSGSVAAALVAGIPIIDIAIKSVIGDELVPIKHKKNNIEIFEKDGCMYIE